MEEAKLLTTLMPLLKAGIGGIFVLCFWIAVKELASVYRWNTKKKQNQVNKTAYPNPGNGNGSGPMNKDKVDLAIANHRQDCTTAIFTRMDQNKDTIISRIDKITGVK